LVGDVVVVGVPDDEWGELVGALVVPADDDLTVDAVESYCRERLAGFKLPRVVSFVEELPRTASGTVERAAARDRLVDGMSGSESGADRELDLAVDDDADDDARVDETATRRTAAEEGAGVADDAGDEDVDEPVDARADTENGVDDAAGGGDEAETFLIGGSDWSPGERVQADEADDPDEEPTAEGDDPPEEPETPDFVREVLPDDEPADPDERVDSEEPAETEDDADGTDDAADETG
jgi:O-succinylbenzoic acid--CoA ligase